MDLCMCQYLILCKGIKLSREDKFSAFQSDYLVYHGNVWDYSTNEPTLDGTAGTLFFISHFARWGNLIARTGNIRMYTQCYSSWGIF